MRDEREAGWLRWEQTLTTAGYAEGRLAFIPRFLKALDKEMKMITAGFKVYTEGEGLILHSGPGRDLIFKATGDDTGGAFDYFIVQVAPKNGPPLHVHHIQEETIHVLKGRYKVRIGDEIFYLEEGGFAYLPSKVPHTFLNLTDETGEIIVVYTPGGGHRFYEELGPLTRNGRPDPKDVAAVFEKYNMSVLGPPLSPD